MAAIKKQMTLKKLKRKSFWPSVTMFLLFAVVCVGLVFEGLQLLSNYILGTRLSTACSEAMDTGILMERLIDEKGDLTYAVNYVSKFRDEHTDVYVTDKDGNMVVHTSENVPDLNLQYNADIGDGYELYPNENAAEALEFKDVNVLDMICRTFLDTDTSGDSYTDTSVKDTSGKDTSEKKASDTVTGGAADKDTQADTSKDQPKEKTGDQPMDQLEDGAKALFGGNTKDRGEWMREKVIESSFWVRVHWEQEDYNLYVEETIELQRQDVYYISRIALITLVVLLIPLVILFINTITNICMQRATARLLYMDPVTGGHNWIFFQGNAQRQLELLHNAPRAYALIDLHLVHYANYVNCYGSDAGENLLECMDGFLKARMRIKEIYGHYGGADFGLLLRCHGANEEERRDYCQERLRMLLAELASLQPERKLHFHAGVCLISPQELSGKVLRRRKNVNINQLFSYASAAQRAEDSETRQIFFFDNSLLEKQNWEQWVESHMQTALTAGEFEVYYQPKYEPASGRLAGAEALVRWNCADRGLIPPGKFIPIFESNGFIMKLDDYMISKVAKQQVEWALQGKKTVPVSVNVSRVHFAMDDLAEQIEKLIDSYGAKHEMIELEVTESAVFDDKQQLVETINRLRAYGFPVSMDDFGAGYSSLNSLKDIPLDVLKLDAEFFRGDDVMGHAQMIVRETIDLAHQLGLRVVAEGIEKKEQVDFLAAVGCDMIQGFYFARPLPLAEFEERMERDI